MSREQISQRLVWHGVVLFFVGLLVGVAVPLFANPRMGLSGHVGALMTGTFILAVGLAWERVRLEEAKAVVAYRLGIFGSYVTTAALVWAAAFGTSRSTPIAGAGHGAAPWQEGVADAGFISSSLALLAFCGLLLQGLRARANG